MGATTTEKEPTTRKVRSENGAVAGEAIVDEVAAGDTPDAPLVISRIALTEMTIPLIGLTPLITNHISEKSRRKMLDAMRGKKTPKEPKNPKAEYEAAFYRLEDGSPAAPASAFLMATISAARFFGRDVTMVGLRQFLFVEGEVSADGQMLVGIEGKPEMVEHLVKVGRNGSDLRYRPMFREWQANVRMVFASSALTEDSVLSLVDAGGWGVGVCEWRPERKGTCGRFKINEDREVTFKKVQ